MHGSVRPLAAALTAVLVLAACKKPEAETSTETAVPAAAEPAAVAVAAPAQTEQERAAAEKQAKIDLALANQKIVDDPDGQWATQATASSTYATVIGNFDGDWKPEAAVGAPDAADNIATGKGWSPAQQNAGIEWLELKYARPVAASAVRVRLIAAPGAIVKVELIDESGARHTVWEGRDDGTYTSGEINWFERHFDPTPYKANGVRLTLATNAIDDRTYLDAVQLVGR
jgi:hypothetical protein